MQQEVKEKLMIIVAHAIGYPGTVVIHFHHAAIAHAAVVRTWWF